jgi:hypothetical protein
MHTSTRFGAGALAAAGLASAMFPGASLARCASTHHPHATARSAAVVKYRGKTRAGDPISFTLSGSRLTHLSAFVPTLCLPISGTRFRVPTPSTRRLLVPDADLQLSDQLPALCLHRRHHVQAVAGEEAPLSPLRCAAPHNRRRTPLRDDLDAAGGAVEPDAIAGAQALGAVARVDHAGDAELAGDNGGVAEGSADVDDQPA